MFITLAAAGLVSYRQASIRSRLDEQIKLLDEQAEKDARDIEFGTFDTQDVDTFITNVDRQVSSLEQRKSANEVVLANQNYFSAEELESAKADLEETNQMLDKYGPEREFMALAWIDYNVLRQDSKSVDLYIDFVKNTSEFAYLLQKSLAGSEQPVYVHTGQIIGMQGCSGVCTGTHLHLVTTVDGVEVDPCTLLPLTPLTIWGSKSVCGVPASKIAWPFYLPWIVTQEFGVISPVVHDVHNALDIIDREYAPVLAAHDGWIYTERRDCTGAVICNSGAANIVKICTQKDCRAGITTEYWHLAWMVEER
ncbi:hypothetical protein KC640_01680 [Candidatus Dojkabacteria bacterium]|uniref:M23 family metallopeptidase n=1 Tax=Candidatus Dojkabacteria bacterium TaxID=2099670 RepID=A0A955L0E8_9BACT|nr:hypothetical protein [Candidatus Dojkabacteria bacterium]